METHYVRRTLTAIITSLLLPMALLLCLRTSLSPAAAQETGVPPTGLDVVLLLDNSVSMDATDPDQLRIQAGRFLVEYLLAAAPSVDLDVRMGVISFGSTLGIVLPLTPLNDPTVQNSIQAQRLAYTDFATPLQAALEQFAASDETGRQKAVILFTDGHPQLTQADATLSAAQITQYFQGLEPLANELQTAGVDIFVIGIGDAVSDQNNWQRFVKPTQYYSLTRISQLANIYHDIVSRLLKIQSSNETGLARGASTIIEIEPYLERVVISCLTPNTTDGVTLADPNGQVINKTTNGPTNIGFSVYTINNPTAGQWTLTASETGDITFWVDRQWPQAALEVIAPDPYPGRPITLTASVLRNGVVITAPLTLEATITNTLGVDPINLSPLADGQYQAIWTPTKTGVYSLTVSTQVDGPVTARPSDVQRLAIVAPPVISATATLTPITSPTVQSDLVEPTPFPVETITAESASPGNSPANLSRIVTILLGTLAVILASFVGFRFLRRNIFDALAKSSHEEIVKTIEKQVKKIEQAETSNKNTALDIAKQAVDELKEYEIKNAADLGEQEAIKHLIEKYYVLAQSSEQELLNFYEKVLSSPTGIYVLARFMIANWEDLLKNDAISRT